MSRSPIPDFLSHLQARPPPPTAAALRRNGLDPNALHQLALNECPHPPSPHVSAAIAAHAQMTNRYPDAHCPALSERIERDTGVAQTRIVWGLGSEEVLRLTVAMVSAGGRSIVAAKPTFAGYPAMYQAAGARVTCVPLLADGDLDLQAMLSSIDEDTGLLILVVPNNPSGVMPPMERLERVVRETPEHVLLLIDGAYHEFARHAGHGDVLDLLKTRRGPWLATRTFSKAYALAGLRIGYGLCDSQALAEALHCYTGPLHIPGLVQIAAQAAYDDGDYTRFILDENAVQRERLLQGLRGLGLQPLASVCNFISVATARPGRELAQSMLERGVLITAWQDPGYEHYIRISLGNAAATEAVLRVLAEAL